jgi:prepilin-type N-terminal cleavage/methylation domain-containing protein
VSRARRHRRGGFTLIETMVALGLTAVVLAALAVAVPAAMRAERGARARLERATTARTVLIHLERELANALAEPVVVSATPRPLLEFTGGTEPGERLAYTIEGTTLVRRAAPRFATEPDIGSGGGSGGGPGVRVLADVAALEVRAFDGREWLAQWHASVVPEAVRVRIVFTDGDAVATVAAIPIAHRRSAS